MRRVLVLLVVAGAVLGWSAPDASSHALVRSTAPEKGASVASAPEAVTITFTEEPDPGLSSIEVLDASGTTYEQGAAAQVPGDPLTLRVAMGDLKQGVYTVSWRAFSQVDGHVTGGAFVFGVGVPAEEITAVDVPEPQTPSPALAEVAGRWALYVGLALLLGTSWVTGFAFRARPPGVRLLFVAGWVVSVAGLLSLATAQLRASGAGFARFLASPIGEAVLWRGVGIAAAGAALVVALGAGGVLGRLALGAVAVAAAGAAFAHAAAGHAATGSFQLLKVAAQWTHIVAIGAWIGGLAALVVGIRGAPDDEKTQAVGRFSAVAAFALAIVAGTGIWRAVNEVGSFGRVFSTPYGRVVAAKVGALGAIALLAAVNRYRNVPRAPEDLRGLRRVSAGELVLAVGVFVLAGLLASLVPAKSVVLSTEPESIVVTGADFGRTTQIRLEITPGFPGPNAFEAQVTEPGTTEPLEAGRVALRFTPRGNLDVGPSTLELSRQERGVWAAQGSNLSVGGVWRIVALVGRGTASSEIDLTVATRCRTDTIRAAGQPTLHDIELGEGREVQGYADPGAAGYNEIHFTFFTPDGEELPISGPIEISALPIGGETAEGDEPPDQRQLEVRRFSPGHYIGGGELVPGVWRFEVRAEQTTGERFAGCFAEMLE